VPVEVVVNGRAVAAREVVADGSEQEVKFTVPIESSGGVCLPSLPSSHTNPIFVLVGGKPIRASRRSAEWCLKAVDKCREQKRPNIRPGERPEAEKAFDQARAAYKMIAAECRKD